MLVDYPTGLMPCILKVSFAEEMLSPKIQTEMYSGRVRHRLIYTKVPRIISVEWHFELAEDAALFEAWFHDAIHDGANWFNIPLNLPTGNGIYQARFAEMYSGPKLIGRSQFKIKADLEIIF